MFTHLYRQSISCILSTILLGNALYGDGIVVDTTAAASHRPTMESTANAIPLINIVAPNTSGLSHNKFNEFNINPSGVIFNNATSAALTQLGGWVQGNANLGATPARVILSEVTGTNRSLLHGYGEVAGHRADLIIANPNGIIVNGGGFINTSRATLTTGSAQLNGDTLEGFHVRRGDILIEGTGLNTTNVDRVELYTKALQLNAQIHAKGLDVITGENVISRDGTITSDNVIGTEEFSIDSSALGGIYADTIRLVGTNKGVGINLPQITYASDSLELSADGKIIIGSAYATNKIDVSSGQDAITLTTDVATNALTLTASKALLNTGKVSVNNASIHAGILTNDIGATFTAQTVDATVVKTITNNGELIAQTASIATYDLLNNGSMVTDTIVLDIDHSLSNTGLLSAYTHMDIRASDMSSGASAEIAAKDFTITLDNGFSNEGTIDAETMSLTANTFLNQGDIYTDTINILSNQMVQNAGTVTASLSATIEAKSLANTSDATISSTALNMNIEEDITNAGSIIAHNGSMNADNMENSGNLIVDTANLNLLYSLTNTGVISGSEKITLHASDMVNSASAEIAAKEMGIVLSDNFSNSGSFISDTVSLKAHSLTNIGEMYGSVMSMELTDSITNQGTLSAFTELDLHTASLANQSGATLEATTLNAEATSGINNQGMLRASTLSLVTPTLTNDATILADTLAVEATNVTNNALLKGSDSAHITVSDTITNNGGIVGGNELAIHGRTITNNEVLYSANAIDLSASNILRNTEGSLIKSASSITIHDTGTLRNEAARIEADGDISIQSGSVENLSTTIPTKTSSFSSISGLDYLPNSFRDWYTRNTATETIDKTGYTPSYILSGGNMLINAAIHNRYSMIATNGDLYLLGSLNNEAALDAHTIIDGSHYVEHWESHGHGDAWYHNYSYFENSDTITDHVYSTIQAGGSIYGNLISVNNADVVSGSPVTNFSSQSIASPTVGSISSTGVTYRSTDTSAHDTLYRLPDGKYGEFVRVSNPDLPYLIESNPLYTDYNTFIGSEYIMSRLNLNMAANTKRFGDARYETQLVRDAVFRLTGERYLAGFGSDTTQYQALMDNAFAVSEDLHLELGVSLNAAQVAALNRDIVWMEERMIAGQKVLVPIVYLASLKIAELSGGGKIIAGTNIQLTVSESINNAGEIRAGSNLIAIADRVSNTGGFIKSAGDILLHTTGNITNTSGTIRGNNVALVSDNGNVVSQTAIKSIDLSKYAGTTGNLSAAGERASIQASGDMLVSAKNDITLKGAETSAGGNAVLTSTTGDVTLTALEQNSHYTTTWSQGTSEIESVKQHSSTLSAGSDVSINAAKDVTLHSSAIAGANVALNAGENVNITAANDREFMDVQTHNKSTFSSSSKRDMTLKESVVFSAINADNISITSGKDTTLQAANLKAAQNIQVDASGDINVIAKQYRQGELHEEHKSSLGGLSKSVSIDQFDSLNLQAATLKTEAKNIIMNSGKDINIIASKIDSAADVQLKAFEDLLIAAGEEQSSQKHIREKTSFNIAGTVGMATGMIGLDTGSLYTQETHKKENYDTTAKSSSIRAGKNITADTGSTTIIGSTLDVTNDVTIKADIGGINVLTSQELSNASTLDKKTEIKLVNLKEMIQGEVDRAKGSLNSDGSSNTKVKVKVASATFDEREVQSSAVHNTSSNITSHNGSVKLDSSDDITITGSNLQAAESIDLKSTTGNITIQEATDSQSVDSKEKHASAEISGTVQNEYVEIGSAVKAAIESAKQLKKVKEDYQNYKRSVKELESTLSTIKQQYRDKVPGVDYADIEDMGEIISNTKDDEKYYVAAIAASTADLASKSVAIAAQIATAAASSGTWGFSVGMQLDMKGSKTASSDTNTQALASNLNAKNITIQTDTATPTTTTISGSNVVASDSLNITTHDLDVHSSVDTTTSKSDSKDLTASIGITMYGGGASSASLGYGEQHATAESETNHNSNLNANTMNINVTNDANFKGATVRADETLNLTVGNNLSVESVRDSSTSSSNGFNMSAGLTTTGSSSTANASVGTNTGRTLNKQTVLTSLTGDKVNITVGEETHLKGSLVAAGSTDENGVFQDNKNLNLSTKILTFENSTNTNYSSSNSMNVGAVYTDKGINPNTKKEDKGISSVSTSFSTGMNYERTKTLATLGQGTITIKDKANSDDLERLNTDTTQVDKSLFKTSTGTSVDARLDTRLLTTEGRAQIKQEYKDMDKNMKTIADTLPDAKSDNKVEAIAGMVWDNLTGFTGGVLPSHANNGGVLGQIPGLSGNPDSSHEILGDQNSKNVYIEGILNTASDAMQGGDNIIGKDADKRIWLNPTHGILGDLIESGVDLIGNNFGIQTGISRQAQLFQENNKDLNIYLHSQGHLVAKEGAKSSKDNGHTYFSYGSPISKSEVQSIYHIKNDDKLEIQQNEGDYVSHPLNIFNPRTWSMPGHATENYGAAKAEKNNKE